jgi:hypothetical protein
MAGNKVIYSITEADELNRTSKTNALCNIVVLYDYNEKEKSGVLIPTEKLLSFTLNENIFGTLPRLHISFFDDGLYFRKINFVIGKKLYIKVTPRPVEGMKLDMTPAPYIESVFTIQDVQSTFQPNIRYNYTLDCTYGSMAFLGKICFWPKKITPLDVTPEFLSSKEVLMQVAADAGFDKPSCQFTNEPLDKMNWLSTNYTYEQFIKKIISHAWLGEDDAPFYYIDKDGKFYLSSLRTCGEKSVVGRYVEITRLHQMKADKDTTVSNYRGYNEGTIQNMGFVANDGGNAAGTYVFNPMHTPIMDPKTLAPVIMLKPIAGAFDIPKHYRKYTTDPNTGSFITGIDNRAASTVANMKYLNNATHFMENHQYYDIAPGHNKALIRRFFQIFASIMYNTNTQTLKDYEPSQRVKLTDKINIDFSGLAQTNTSVHSGDYIVATLTHAWANGGAYSINIVGVRDTITAQGSLIE